MLLLRIKLHLSSTWELAVVYLYDRNYVSDKHWENDTHIQKKTVGVYTASLETKLLFLNWIQDLEYMMLYIWKGALMNVFAVHVSILFDQEMMTGETRSNVALLGNIDYVAILM